MKIRFHLEQPSTIYAYLLQKLKTHNLLLSIFRVRLLTKGIYCREPCKKKEYCEKKKNIQTEPFC